MRSRSARTGAPRSRAACAFGPRAGCGSRRPRHGPWSRTADGLPCSRAACAPCSRSGGSRATPEPQMIDRGSIVVASLAAAIAWCAGADAQKVPDRVEVEAERLTIDQGRHTARFEGSVVARYGTLTLTCDE